MSDTHVVADGTACSVTTVGKTTVAYHKPDCRHFRKSIDDIDEGQIEAIAAAVCEFRDPEGHTGHDGGSFCHFNRELVRLVLREAELL